MATARKNEAVTETKTVVVEPETVTLTLTLDEADTLAAIAGKIGGDPDRSPRKHVDEIARVLAGVGFHWANGSKAWQAMERERLSGIRFNKYPEED